MKSMVKTDQVPVSIGIDEKARARVSEILSTLLADEHVLYIKTRNYHWNVQGIHFQPLHAFFEEQYNTLEAQIDEIAERMRSLGFFAPGSMQAYLDRSRLQETDELAGAAQKMLQHLLLDHEAVIQVLRNNVEETDEIGDTATSDFLTGLMAAHEKMAWMLRAHLA
ncbi:MAG: DNA starvation/stationary phase protection protein [Phaeodactylibacter sp.]|nr:DNA starvation/stationary phase protection protein [Phaeodactylibacter sp.]